jgi:PAS domain S-box-containing protein
MKTYVRWDADDEQALRALLPVLAPSFRSIAETFYQRIAEHEEAHRVFQDQAQVERLKSTLCLWMQRLLHGPWDDEYAQLRSRIGRQHVKVGLPQRYMFGAMNLIRQHLTEAALRLLEGDEEGRRRALAALGKILDLELMLMLDTYHEADLDRLRRLERGQRQRLQAELEMSEARAGEMVEAAALLISTFELNGRMRFCNRRAAEALGLEPGLLEGPSWFERCVAPEQRQAVQQACARVVEGEGVARHEGTLVAHDGGLHRVRWSVTTLPAAGGPLLCAMGVDITEEHELAVRTRRAERMASLGTMAAGLAHELRNPLNSAHLQLAVLERRLGGAEGPDVPAAVQAARAAGEEVQRLTVLVDEFLEFARPHPLELAEHELRGLVSRAVQRMQRPAERAGVRLVLDPGPEVRLEVDGERLKEALANLLRNAIEAIAASQRPGTIRISVSQHEGGGRVEVMDDGPGIAADQPIFEPFFTTKPQGTGLGLSIVHRVIEDHGGKVSYRSQPGRTVFSVALPGHA